MSVAHVNIFVNNVKMYVLLTVLMYESVKWIAFFIFVTFSQNLILKKFICPKKVVSLFDTKKNFYVLYLLLYFV